MPDPFLRSRLFDFNSLATVLFLFLGGFQGHPSIVAQEKAVAFKVFISLFLNTACIVLLINSAPPEALSQYSLNGQPVFAGQHTGFDTTWHTEVGASIVLTSALRSC